MDSYEFEQMEYFQWKIYNNNNNEIVMFACA